MSQPPRPKYDFLYNSLAVADTIYFKNTQFCCPGRLPPTSVNDHIKFILIVNNHFS